MRIFCRLGVVAFLALIAGFSPVVGPISAVGAAGLVLVADQGSGSIQLYSTDGVSLGVFASGLSSPSWITVDGAGNVYVSEPDAMRISRFSPTGTPLSPIPTTTFQPGGVRVAADGTIYVADYFGGNVYAYSTTGGNFVLFASGLGQADFMVFDAAGRLYVTDPLLGVVRCFDPRALDPSRVDLGDFVAGFGGPAGIAFDANGNLYVASFNSNIIQKFSPDPQSPPGECKAVDQGTFAFLDPTGEIMGLAFDAAGSLYVANYALRNVQRFSSSGVDLGVFAATGLQLPRDVAIMPGTAAPAVKEECKQDGWQSFDAFSNQGDCIQFLNTGK